VKVRSERMLSKGIRDRDKEEEHKKKNSKSGGRGY
jgi:hypothetical protein